FRLRDSSHIQQQITKLLEDLLRRLKDVRGILAKGEGVDDGDSDVESIGYTSSEDEAPQTELHQLRRNVATIINLLFEISILVRKPARHDIRIGAKQSDVSGYEWADLRHVKDKFPKVNDLLAARLGQAITRRRKYLVYRKRHADKLRKGIDHDVPTGSAILSETAATDVRTWIIDADDRPSESGFSQTSYGPTLMSGGAITIPNPPKASHNARHLQELALFILPRKDDDDSDVDDSDAKLGAHSSRGSSSSIPMGDKVMDLPVYDAPTEAADDAKVVDEFSSPHSPHARRKSRARSPSYDDDDNPKERESTMTMQELERQEKKVAASESPKLIADGQNAAKKEEDWFRIRALAEFERKKYEEEMKEKRLKEEKDKVFKARLKDMYLAEGYSEESLEIMINTKDAQEKKKRIEKETKMVVEDTSSDDQLRQRRNSVG
ncbi:MAG: hypothetical protein L6R35_007317, partial [Caloplaca aegaea]